MSLIVGLGNDQMGREHPRSDRSPHAHDAARSPAIAFQSSARRCDMANMNVLMITLRLERYTTQHVIFAGIGVSDEQT
jgi:hypothetical protein